MNKHKSWYTPDLDADMRTIIIGSSVGTLIEWYDFFVYGSLATTLASKFYQTGTPDGDVIAWLGSFAVGFLVRPVGAVLFGYLGDKYGRKYTFSLSMLVMGLCTFLIGCLPTYDQIGVTAGYILILLRILQGLAIGGEYGGAAIYIAEHAPHNQRGFYTSFIQVSATLGLLSSLLVILLFRLVLGEASFMRIGWRFPFLSSIVLVAGSVYIRSRLEESPLFNQKKRTGGLSKNPLSESFGRNYNLKFVALALFAATMGQGVIWYTGQFYVLYFIQTVLKVPTQDSYVILSCALILSSPFFILVGYLSDIYGRKPFLVSGMLLSLVTWYPIFMLLYYVRPYVDPTAAVLEMNMNYSPAIMIAAITVLVFYVALVYGPIAAFLVELFPTSIRYTSLSLPYHIGNGVFGGLVPVVGLALVTATGSVFSGLWYPMAVAFLCLILMIKFLPETYQVDIARIEDYPAYA